MSGNTQQRQHDDEEETSLDSEAYLARTAIDRKSAQVGAEHMLDRFERFRSGEQEKHQSGVKTVFYLKKQVHLRFFLVLRVLFLRG